MARRRLLARDALVRHYDLSVDDREITQHFTLSREDLYPSQRRLPIELYDGHALHALAKTGAGS